VSQRGQHLLKLKVLELGSQEIIPGFFFKRNFGDLRFERSPDCKKDATGFGIHDLTKRPASLSRLVLPKVDIRFCEVAGHTLNLISLLGRNTIGPLFLGMCRTVTIELGTFVFEDLPRQLFLCMVNLVENAVGRNTNPRQARML
jgi:hypothetical protein